MEKDLQINLRVSRPWLEERKRKRDALKPSSTMSQYLRDMIELGEAAAIINRRDGNGKAKNKGDKTNRAFRKPF